MSTGHTPGPWYVRHAVVGERTGRTEIRTQAAGIGEPVAAVWRGEKGPASSDADARLIAAAPDLLAALERANSDLLEIGGNCDCDGECANCTRVEEASGRVVAAIAKAVGK